MPSLDQIAAQNLKRLRLRKKLSQRDLATKAGISISYVSMLERGLRSPALSTLESLSTALEVPPAKLLAA